MLGLEPTPACLLGSCPNRSQAGFSLIEVLLSIVIFVLVASSILTGVTLIVRVAGNQQGRAAVTVESQNYADLLRQATYTSCATPDDYSVETLGGHNQPQVTVVVDSVRYWNRQPLPSNTEPTDAQWNAAFSNVCAAGGGAADNGLQRVTYSAVSDAGGRITKSKHSVLKRFNGAKPEPQTDPIPGGSSCSIAATDRVASTWVNETLGKQGTNYSTGSGSGELNILYLAGTRRYSYLRFDLSPNTPCVNGGTLPSGADIVAAEVGLYTFNIGGLPACGANSCWHVMERVRSSWNPSTLTWANQPCPTGYAASCQPGGTKSDILFEHGTGAFNWSARAQRIRATQLLNDVRSFYSTPSTNFGWVIKEACAETYKKACGSATPGFQMRSSRVSNVAERPTLTVWF